MRVRILSVITDNLEKDWIAKPKIFANNIKLGRVRTERSVGTAFFINDLEV